MQLSFLRILDDRERGPSLGPSKRLSDSFSTAEILFQETTAMCGAQEGVAPRKWQEA